MNELFSEKFQAVLVDLTRDLRYWSSNEKQLIAPQVVKTLPPPPGSAAEVDSEYPMVCWAVYKGEISTKPQPVRVLVDMGIKVDETSGTTIEQIRHGSANITQLISTVGELKNNRRIGGYRLQMPFEFIIGDQSPGFEGAQPHPYYHGRIYLSFLPM